MANGMTPEQRARQNIAAMLISAGWVIQDVKQLNLSANIGVAVREYPTDSGPADYILFVDKEPAGVIEAKQEADGYKLTTVAEQTGKYATSKLTRG